LCKAANFIVPDGNTSVEVQAERRLLNPLCVVYLPDIGEPYGAQQSDGIALSIGILQDILELTLLASLPRSQ
jgi:hypothetical protein